MYNNTSFDAFNGPSRSNQVTNLFLNVGTILAVSIFRYAKL
jgi:hypothetical protein